MKSVKLGWVPALLSLSLAMPVGCGDDSDGSEADRLGIAAICTDDPDCPMVETRKGGTVQLSCLTDFKGGYCGIFGCSATVDCPKGSLCVRHTDKETYCFRECATKLECNRNRPSALEANCSSSFDFNDSADDEGEKSCIPPSSGI